MEAMVDAAEPFAFDPKLTPEENVRAFLVHLEQRDRELAGLLRDNLGDLVAASEGDSEARRKFNRAVVEALDHPPEDAPS